MRTKLWAALELAPNHIIGVVLSLQVEGLHAEQVIQGNFKKNLSKTILNQRLKILRVNCLNNYECDLVSFSIKNGTFREKREIEISHEK